MSYFKSESEMIDIKDYSIPVQCPQDAKKKKNLLFKSDLVTWM